MQGVGDFDEVPRISKRSRRLPVIRAGGFKEYGVVKTDALLLEVDNECAQTDNGIGKGSWNRRLSISIPDACDQLRLSHINAD
jgi:hypothetical protein